MLRSLPHRSFALFLLFATSVARVALPLNHNDTEFSPDPNLNLTKREPGASGATVALTVGKEDTYTGYPLYHYGKATIGTTGEGRTEGWDYVNIRCNFLLSNSKLVASHDYKGDDFEYPQGSTVLIPNTANKITFADHSWFENIISVDAFTVGGFTIPKISGRPTQLKYFTQYYANVYDFWDPTNTDASACGMGFADDITFENKLPEAANSPSWIMQMYEFNFITPQFGFDLGRTSQGMSRPTMYLGSALSTNLLRRGSEEYFTLNSGSQGYQHDSLRLTVYSLSGAAQDTEVVRGVFDNGDPMLLLPEFVFAEVLLLLQTTGVASAESLFVDDEDVHTQGTFLAYNCREQLPPIALTFIENEEGLSFRFSTNSLDYSLSWKETSQGDVIKKCILPIQLSSYPFAVIGMPLFLSWVVGFTFAQGQPRQIVIGERAQ